MYLRHRLTYVCILRPISHVTSPVSHPYKCTDFTQALKILILVTLRIDVDSHTFLNLENDSLAICYTCSLNMPIIFLHSVYRVSYCPHTGETLWKVPTLHTVQGGGLAIMHAFLTWGPWIDFKGSVNVDSGGMGGLQLYFYLPIPEI
jgi:hypothetical protein